MPDINTTLALIFLIIVALGGFFAGRRSGRDGVDMGDLFEARDNTQASSTPPKEITDSEVFENVLSFFEQAHTSRQLLHILATSEEKLSYSELTNALNQYLNRKRKSTLPKHAVQNVVMILMGANLVQMRDGDLAATAAGKRLWGIIRERQP